MMKLWTFWVGLSLALLPSTAARAAETKPRLAAIITLHATDPRQDRSTPLPSSTVAAEETAYLALTPPSQEPVQAPSDVRWGGDAVKVESCPAAFGAQYAKAFCVVLPRDTLKKASLTYARLDVPVGVEVVPLPAAPVDPTPPPPPPEARKPEAAEQPATPPPLAACDAKCEAPAYTAYCQGLVRYQQELKEAVKRPTCEEGARHHIDRMKNVVLLVYGEDGKPVEPLPQLDEDDTVIVSVEKAQKLQVTECAAPDPVRVAGTIADGVLEKSSKDPAQKLTALPRVAKQCSTSSGVRLSAQLANDDVLTLNIPTLPLHRITIGLGLIYDFTRTSEWRTDAVKGESVPVLVKDRKSEGITPVAFLALRLTPVDTVRVRKTFCEIVAPTVGVSLSNPLDHLYLGLLVEPMPGLGALVGYHFRRVESPRGGYQEGDRVPGGAITTDKRWGGNDWNIYTGFYLDSRVMASILGGLNL